MTEPGEAQVGGAERVRLDACLEFPFVEILLVTVVMLDVKLNRSVLVLCWGPPLLHDAVGRWEAREEAAHTLVDELVARRQPL